jgi:alkanesulfonate monooxygenase SsuD/methylene tetrahydromethanopterin reductase-like flavin-dependent oxidoreductase (luciferase family)
VGGNGPKVTWRLAARFADELCLDALLPDAVAKALPVIRARCEELGRDPASLQVAVHIWGEPAAVAPGPARQQRLGEYADLGVDQVIVRLLGRPPSQRPGRADGGLRRRRAAGTGAGPVGGGTRLVQASMTTQVALLGQRRSTMQVSVRVTPSTSWMREATSLPS